MKAYQVHDGHECWVVVFATSGIAARRLGAQQIDCDFSEIDSCNRVPQYDQYAPGPVPALALIAHGWRFECSGCSRLVEREMLDDNDDILDIVPVEVNGEVYCCEGCRQISRGRVARQRRVEGEAIEAAIGWVVSKYQGSAIMGVHVHLNDDLGYPYVNQCFVQFAFPGSRHTGAEIRFDQDKGIRLFVARGDMEAWENWKGHSPIPKLEDQ